MQTQPHLPSSGDLPHCAQSFLHWLRINDYASGTIDMRAHQVKCFIAWCEQRSITMPQEVTTAVLEQYQSHLAHLHTANQTPISAGYRKNQLISLTMFFDWLAKNDAIINSPISALDLPKVPRRIPRHILTDAEAQQIINQPDTAKPRGIRDRAIMETLYSTAMRRIELTRLTRADIDFDHGTVKVRGKRNQERIIPIGRRALQWIENYLRSTRPTLPSDILFLNQYGHPFDADGISALVSRYVKAANIGKPGSCHIFRHTAATLMLENGADIRHIQQILGHRNINTTQIYTKVSIGKLKEIHTRTHPAKSIRSDPQ